MRSRFGSFLAGADDPTDTLLVVGCDGYATIVVEVSGSKPFENVGTVHLSRVVALGIHFRDAHTGEGVEQGEVELKELGGNRPDRLTRSEFAYPWLEHTCDRREGRFELRVRAPGYREWVGEGELSLTNEHEIQVDLVPDG
jgi:hypothetical protein